MLRRARAVRGSAEGDHDFVVNGQRVQVGIRDYCDEELDVVKRAMGRVVTWFDEDLKAQQYEGHHWNTLCDRIVNDLPENVYISFDIDGGTHGKIWIDAQTSSADLADAGIGRAVARAQVGPQRIELAFRLCYSRAPSAEERDACLEYLGSAGNRGSAATPGSRSGGGRGSASPPAWWC